MMRRYLRGNAASGTPSLFVAFDTETRPRQHPTDPSLEVNPAWLVRAVFWRTEGGRVRQREEFCTRKRAEFLAWLQSKSQPKKRLWVFAHWLHYDLTAVRFWDCVTSGAYRFAWRRHRPPSAGEQDDQAAEPTGLCVLTDPPLILDMETCQGYRTTFVDLMNWWPHKLSKLGQWIGHEALPLPGDEATDDAWDDKCRRDVEIVERCVNKLVGFVKGADLGNMRYTIAGQSLAHYRHRCNPGNLLLGQPDAVKAGERAAYYGLLSRAYYLGAVEPCPWHAAGDPDYSPAVPGVSHAGPVYRLDVNSCYPYVMWSENYPVAYRETWNEPETDLVERRLGCDECIAEVTVRSDRRPNPRRVKDGAIWMTGRFVTWLAGPELRSALGTGEVAKVHQCHWYDRGRPFVRWAESIWELRRQCEEKKEFLLADAVKSMSVSLYGKMAQLSPRWQLRKDVVPNQDWGTYPVYDDRTGEWEVWRGVGGTAQQQLKPAETDGSFPALAAYVTSHARLHMRRLHKAAGIRQVFYEDADSLHVSRQGYQNLRDAGLIDPSLPGKLKVEKEVQRASWRGPKNYCHDGVWVMAGVRDPSKIDPVGLVHETRFHGCEMTLNGPPPDGPISKDVEIKAPEPQQLGRVGPDRWVEWPCYYD